MTAGVDALYPAVRGLILLSIILIAGLVVAPRLARRHLVGEPMAGAIAGWHDRLPGLFAWFLLMLSLARGALQLLTFTEPGEPIAADLVSAVLLEGTWGHAWVMQTASALLLLAGSWALRTRREAASRLTAGCCAVIILAQSGMGHPADDIWVAPLGRIISVLHVTGAGLWLGTLAILSVSVFPALRREGAIFALASIVRDFSGVARVGAALVAASGAIAAWKYVGSLDALAGTGYGRLVMIKIGLFAVIAAAGWWNWKVITPRLERADAVAVRGLNRAMAIELVLGGILIAITALLVATPLPE